MAIAGPTPYFGTKVGFAVCEICGKIGEKDTWYLAATYPYGWDRQQKIGPMAMGGRRNKRYYNTKREKIGHREKLFHFNNYARNYRGGCSEDGCFQTRGFPLCNECHINAPCNESFKDRDDLHAFCDKNMPYQIEARQRLGREVFKIYSHTEFEIGQVVKVPGTNHEGKKKIATLDGPSNFEYITIIEKKDNMVIVEPRMLSLLRTASKIRDLWKAARPGFENLEKSRQSAIETLEEIDKSQSTIKQLYDEIDKLERGIRKSQIKTEKLHLTIKRMEREKEEIKKNTLARFHGLTWRTCLETPSRNNTTNV